MIDKNIFTDKNKLRENWVKNNILDEYILIKKFQIDNNFMNLKFSNVLYNYLNNIIKIPMCEICNLNPKRFLGFRLGYNDYCSKKCASKASINDAIIKRKLNTLKKYGVEHTSQLESVKEKQKISNIKKYGNISPTQNKEIRKKQEITMLNRYGVKYSGENEYLLSKTLSTRFDDYVKNIKKVFKDLNIVKINKEGEVTIKCDVCGNEYNIKTNFLRLRYLRYKINPCLICNPNKSYSYTGQNEIFDFLNKYNINIIRNDRNILDGKEIDLYLPDYNIGIEYNGLYWHSSLFKNKNYHLDKKNNCLSKNINLIHIWEDDWLYKKNIIESRILNLIGKTKNKIYARKCKIVKVDDYKEFLNENHLQGSINSSYNIGLLYNNELVSIMTFGKLRKCLGSKSDNNEWELYRFCSKLNYNVIGAFSKLLNYFEKDILPKKLITYSNRDWSIKNNIYEKCGFKFEYYTKVNYWYFNSSISRIHRFNFRKDKLIQQGFDKNKTEKEIMTIDKGYHIIYDCGSIKYFKEY